MSKKTLVAIGFLSCVFLVCLIVVLKSTVDTRSGISNHIKDAQTTKASPLSSPSAQRIPIISNWKTYSSATFRISFSYPSFIQYVKENNEYIDLYTTPKSKEYFLAISPQRYESNKYTILEKKYEPVKSMPGAHVDEFLKTYRDTSNRTWAIANYGGVPGGIEYDAETKREDTYFVINIFMDPVQLAELTKDTVVPQSMDEFVHFFLSSITFN